jgi:hypothetical protein
MLYRTLNAPVGLHSSPASIPLIFVRRVRTQTQASRCDGRRRRRCGSTRFVRDLLRARLCTLIRDHWRLPTRPSSLILSRRIPSLFCLVSSRSPPNLQPPNKPILPLALLALPRTDSPSLTDHRRRRSSSSIQLFGSPLSLLLLLAELLQVFFGVFLVGQLFRPRALLHRVQELDFVFVQGSKLVRQTI